MPSTLAPPTATVQLDFRVGDNNHCLLRGLDAAGQLTTLTQSTQIQVKFREARFAPAVASTVQLAGYDFAPAGDVNGDGLPDLLVGGGGEAYLVFGSRTLASGIGAPSTPDVKTARPSSSRRAATTR